MTPQTEKELEIFKAWLASRGHVILPCRGEWELLRWNGAVGAPPRILYTNKRGVIASFNNRDAENDWLDALEDTNPER